MLAEIFKKPKPILGKVELLALPGAPGWEGHWEELVVRAEQEATALATGGVDGLLIENTHDTPHTTGRMDTAGAIAMALLTRRIRQFTNLPVGISVLQNDPETALAITINTEADFIRVPLLSGSMMTESGVINNRFNELLQYKNRLKAQLPLLLVDVSTRHLGTEAAQPGQQRLEHLMAIARSVPRQAEKIALVLSDEDIQPSEAQAFRDTVGHPVLVESRHPTRDANDYFNAVDGLLLAGNLRKNTSAQPNLPPTIDMNRVEEIVNVLRQVVPVTEMDPDIFLKR